MIENVFYWIFNEIYMIIQGRSSEERQTNSILLLSKKCVWNRVSSSVDILYIFSHSSEYSFLSSALIIWIFKFNNDFNRWIMGCFTGPNDIQFILNYQIFSSYIILQFIDDNPSTLKFRVNNWVNHWSLVEKIEIIN
jgi:hypothetical protein